MILVDPRKGSGELLSLFLSMSAPAQHASPQLTSADFTFSGCGSEGPLRIGVERKTIPDLLQSLHSERLVGGQLPRLHKDYDRVYLFVEGPMRRSFRNEGMLEYKVENAQSAGGCFSEWTLGWDRGGKGVNWFYVMGRLTSIEETGVVIRRPMTQHDTVSQVVSLYNWWQRPYDEHDSHQAIKMKRLETKEAGPVAITARGAGLGHAGARRAEAHWLSPLMMASAGPEEWLHSGVVKSKAMATRMVKFFQLSLKS